MIKNILIFLSGVIFGCLILILYGLYFSNSTEELIEERAQLNYGYKTEITIKNKIYELTFGMSKDEVKSKIGKPNKVDVSNLGIYGIKETWTYGETPNLIQLEFHDSKLDNINQW
jgi:hypothetical protein